MANAVARGTADNTSAISGAELIRRAADFIPILKERADECERLRRIPDNTRDDFIKSGLTRISQPIPHGGLGLDMDTVLEAALELGRGCGSSAWLGCFWPLHNWMVGMWPKEAQEEYWNGSNDTISSTAWNVLGCQTEEAGGGGIRLSGHWDFSSGIDHADWAMLFGSKLKAGETCAGAAQRPAHR